MELFTYMNMSVQLKDKSMNYIQRFLVAYYNKLSLEQVDQMNENEFNKKLIELTPEYFVDETDIKTTFTHNGKTYRVLPDDEITADHWIKVETLLEKTRDKIENSYPGILGIFTDTKNSKEFHTLDHRVAMPIIGFFLSLYEKLDEDLAKSMKLIMEMQKTHLVSIELVNALIACIPVCYNS